MRISGKSAKSTVVQNRGYSVQHRRTQNTVGHMTKCRMDMCTVWTVLGQHLVDSHGHARPDPSHTETGEINQTLVSVSTLWPRSHDPSAV